MLYGGIADPWNSWSSIVVVFSKRICMLVLPRSLNWITAFRERPQRNATIYILNKRALVVGLYCKAVGIRSLIITKSRFSLRHSARPPACLGKLLSEESSRAAASSLTCRVIIRAATFSSQDGVPQLSPSSPSSSPHLYWFRRSRGVPHPKKHGMPKTKSLGAISPLPRLHSRPPLLGNLVEVGSPPKGLIS
jgi:hypothetical protein